MNASSYRRPRMYTCTVGADVVLSGGIGFDIVIVTVVFAVSVADLFVARVVVNAVAVVFIES